MSPNPRDLTPDPDAGLPPLPPGRRDHVRAGRREPRRGRPLVAVVAVAAAVAGAAVFAAQQFGGDRSAGSVSTTPTPAAATGPAAGTGVRTPVVDTAAALDVARRFVVAWTLPADEQQRRAALEPVASTRLVNTLAPLTADSLPQVDGGPAVAASGTDQVTVTVGLRDEGSAVLALVDTDGAWKVGAVGQEPT